MENLFKNDLRFIINSIDFDNYRDVPKRVPLTFQFNETSNVLLSNSLDKVLVNLITTIYGNNDNNVLIFNLSIKSSVEIILTEKLKVNEKLTTVPDNIRKQAEKIASERNIDFINDFFNNTIFSTIKIKRPDQ